MVVISKLGTIEGRQLPLEPENNANRFPDLKAKEDLIPLEKSQSM
jgi:hypothetical protein